MNTNRLLWLNHRQRCSLYQQKRDSGTLPPLAVAANIAVIIHNAPRDALVLPQRIIQTFTGELLIRDITINVE